MEPIEQATAAPGEKRNVERHDVGGDLVNEDAAARYTGHSARTYQQWRYRGEGPPYIKCGKYVRYSLRDLDGWLLKHRVDPSTAAEDG